MNAVACEALAILFSFIHALFRYIRIRASCWNTPLCRKWHFSFGFHFATNDYFIDIPTETLPHRFCHRCHLIQFSDRLTTTMCARLQAVAFNTLCVCAYVNVSACCPKRSPANHIMGWIIYKENYNLTKAKVEKYIIAIEIVFLLRERLAAAVHL